MAGMPPRLGAQQAEQPTLSRRFPADYTLNLAYIHCIGDPRTLIVHRSDNAFQLAYLCTHRHYISGRNRYKVSSA
jgi:hypothetical protein